MSGSVLLGKMIALWVAGAVAWQASDMLVKTLRATPELDLAARIEGGAAIDQAYLDRFDATYPEARLDGICDARIRRARVSIALARLDLAVTGDDLERVDAARAAVLDQTRRLIACVPTDGNAWLRLAMVEIADGGLTPAVSASFAHADRLAPFEGWVLRGRLPFYADLAARGVEAFREPARRDFALLVEFGTNPAGVVAVVQRWPGLFRNFYLDRLGSMTARERRRHYAAADRVGLDIGQPRQPAETVPFLDPPGVGRRRP
ncbi:hypothetical protein [Prosthecodimorpha staleyi]|uniref:Uncharacterized protein n=1 Tax=Prosthecodimorpha staleyi TaxID=2840188 RepID=A0A947D5C7_9HYPH|nr:hypothetical protein [Prosthecodimorpha staleyi]MBT9288477.1 hypothetical protein [Prosthecodimorpha staleyi]